MASTRNAARLTEAHRQAQLRLGAQTVAQMRAAWRLVDFDDLDGTTGDWLRVAVPIIRAQSRTSSTLAANYYRTFRGMELGLAAGAFTPPIAAPPAVEAITTSLTVTGPATVKRATALGRSAVEAMTLGEARTAAASMRQALAGGRDTLMRSVSTDNAALGYARATSGNSCAFCAMLASRGPVYDESSADFQSHDGCSCTAEPVFSRDAAWPAGSREYADLWDEATAGETDQLNAFRRALSGAE